MSESACLGKLYKRIHDFVLVMPHYYEVVHEPERVSFFTVLCCVPNWVGSKLRSRHVITWLILTLLLFGVAMVLFVYIVPLANKANLVADEARELVKVSLEKIEKVDHNVHSLMQDARGKIDGIDSTVHELVETAHIRLENIDNTVHSFIENATVKLDNMEKNLNNSLQAITVPQTDVLS